MRGVLTALLCAGILAGPTTVAAQQPAMTYMQTSVNELYGDLKFIIETLAQEPKAYATLAETLDVFVIGVDKTQPFVSQIKVRDGEFKTILHVPVTDQKEFLANIKTLDVKVKRKLSPELSQVGGLFEGYMRELKGRAVFAEDQADVAGPLATPQELAATLLKPKFDTGFSVVNQPQSLAERRTAIRKKTDEILAGIKQKKDEDADTFALRRMTVEQQLAELDRFYVESREILLGWTTDTAKRTGSLRIDLSAIEGTPLAESVQLVGKSPSYFASHKIEPTAALSGHINFHLDPLRQKHFAESSKLTRTVALKEIAKDAQRSAADKQRAEQIVNLVQDVFDRCVQQGVFDGFVDVHKAPGGKYVAVGGLKTDGTLLKQALADLKAGEGIQLGVAQLGDLELHTIKLPSDEIETQEMFGKDALLWVGTNREAVWYALGEGARERLQSAVNAVTQPATGAQSQTSLEFHAQAAPWMEFWDKRRTNRKQGDPADRKLALDAFKAGGDVMDFKIQRVGDQVQVHFDLQDGMLRFIGKLLAKYIKEAL